VPKVLSQSAPSQTPVSSPAPEPRLPSPLPAPPTTQAGVPVPDCDVIVFGGTGDLAMRKLLPALWHRDREGQLPGSARIIAVSRSEASDTDYRDQVGAVVGPAVATDDEAAFVRFAHRLHHVTLDATGEPARDPGWSALTDLLRGGDERVRVFYLATAPQLFGPVSRGLQAAGLVTPLSRVVLEKPIGWDLASARAINDEVGEVFDESQVFRIDHYLGKETVQNLLVLRFANTLLEPLWNSSWIDHVQITAAETVGTGDRSGYYDGSGALRDMVQNHLLQLLCLVAMEPPGRLDRDAVRDEKLKVLQALRPMAAGDVARCTVRGQYRAGAVDGEPVPGYSTELGTLSDTETFVALKTEVQNWRWAGVPFYLRTGKRLHKRTSEIVVQFKPVPHSVFPEQTGQMIANRLVIHLQPNESVRLLMMTKEPGPGGLRLRPAPLNLSFADTFGTRFPDAYERLLMDVVRGNPTLFMRRDEVEAAWEWAEPILHGWQGSGEPPRPYHAGTPGPAAAIALIERDGRTWHEDHEEEPSL
jgi:glucose-6-phosphate 1-dehydrogenase